MEDYSFLDKMINEQNEKYESFCKHMMLTAANANGAFDLEYEDILNESYFFAVENAFKFKDFRCDISEQSIFDMKRYILYKSPVVMEHKSDYIEDFVDKYANYIKCLDDFLDSEDLPQDAPNNFMRFIISCIDLKDTDNLELNISKCLISYFRFMRAVEATLDYFEKTVTSGSYSYCKEIYTRFNELLD